MVLFSAPRIFELLKTLIADAIRNAYAIYSQNIRNIYAIDMQCTRFYSLFFAAAPQFMGESGLGEFALHLFSVYRASIKRPLRTCNEFCVCVASDLRITALVLHPICE